MGIRFDGYEYGFKIVSLALDEKAKSNLLKSDLETLYVDDTCITLYPNNTIVSAKDEDIEFLNSCNNYDVLEIWESGVVIRRYNDKSNDNYFFVTGRCNSNCIMCPSPEISRKNIQDISINHLMMLAKHIPSDTPHLTITGGEPFLVGEKIFPFINYIKEKFNKTEFLFLTNGRIFALDKYLQLFRQSVPNNSVVAIPLHASSADIHDMITRAENSFNQTFLGLKKLLKSKIAVELRVVVSKLNINDIDNIASMIIAEFKEVEYVSIIAMEMTGNARTNHDNLWMSYKEIFTIISSSVRKLIENGVDVKLYNFPLCTVEKAFWTLCEKSISENKVRFADTCDKCKYKKNCCGVFAGTFQLEKDELEAII